MKPIIITDANCDLIAEYYKENNIPVIPFHFNLKGQDYEDDFGKSISYKEFYNELRNGEMPTTAQITPFVFEEYFRKYISEGYSIVYIGFSSALYSIIETAKANGIKPYDYLLFLFNLMPTIKSFTSEIFEMLMPWSEQVKETCGYSTTAKRTARDKADEHCD